VALAAPICGATIAAVTAAFFVGKSRKGGDLNENK